MQTAVQKAKQRLAAQEQRIPSQISRDAIQYAWYAASDLTHRDLGPIKRCRWTPIVKQEKWKTILAKPSPDDFAAVRNLRNPSAPPTQGLIWIKPGAIANSLYEEFNEWGLLISPTLMKAAPDLDVFERLSIDSIFFPMEDEALPKTYNALRSQIETVLASIESGALQRLPNETIRTIVAVGKEMLQSLDRTAVYQEGELAKTHQSFEKSKTEQGHRGTYDRRDRAMMAWLEVVPRDEVQNRSAIANETLIELAKQQLVSGAGNAIDYEALGRGIAKGLEPMIATIAKPETKPEVKK